MWRLGIRKGSKAWRRKGAEGRGGGERLWISGYGRIVRVQNGWLQILLSSSKTHRNQ